MKFKTLFACCFDAESSQTFGNLLVGDGAEHLAILAGLQGEVHRDGSNLGGNLLEVGQLGGLALCALLLEHVDETLIGGSRLERKALRNQVVAAVTSLHGNEVGFTAQTFDLRSENNIHVCHNSVILGLVSRKDAPKQPESQAKNEFIRNKSSAPGS